MKQNSDFIYIDDVTDENYGNVNESAVENGRIIKEAFKGSFVKVLSIERLAENSPLVTKGILKKSKSAPIVPFSPIPPCIQLTAAAIGNKAF